MLCESYLQSPVSTDAAVKVSSWISWSEKCVVINISLRVSLCEVEPGLAWHRVQVMIHD